MDVLAICGSLRSVSANLAALQAAAILAPEGMQIKIDKRLGSLPHFNPDLDQDTPPTIVRDLRRSVGLADGLLISVPEYAHGLPGAFKNLLDWLVASKEFPGKPVALINTSPRAHYAQDQLIEVLTTMNADLVTSACAILPLLGRSLTATEVANDPALATELRRALAMFKLYAGQPRPDRIPR